VCARRGTCVIARDETSVAHASAINIHEAEEHRGNVHKFRRPTVVHSPTGAWKRMRDGDDSVDTDPGSDSHDV